MKERKKERKQEKKEKKTNCITNVPSYTSDSSISLRITDRTNRKPQHHPPPPPLRRLTRQRVKVTRCFQIYDNYSYRSYYLSNYIGSFCNPRVKTDSGTRKGKQPTYFVIILSLLYIVCN